MMKRNRILVRLLLAPLALSASFVVRAQEFYGSVFAEAECDGSEVVLTVTMSIVDEIPANLVGWVVDRRVLGKCVADVQVGPIREFPAGEQEYVVVDTPTEVGYQALYYIFAVDDAGEREWIPWPQRTHFAQADCVGGATARGTVIEIFDSQYYLEVCPDQCWYEMSYFDEHLPPEAPELVGEVIDVYGDLVLGMEGYYIDVSGWDYSPEGCGQVAVQRTSWSALKLPYR